VIDRDQSASEHYIVSMWLLLTMSCFTGAALSLVTHRVLAAIAAVPVAQVVIKFPMYIGGVAAIAFRHGEVHRFNTAFTLVFIGGFAWYFATRESWVRYVAIIFFAVIAANAIAAVIVWLLRDRIAQIESAVT
jgi:hypothetical protein